MKLENIPWSECPWAKYAAVDSDGFVFLYEHKPCVGENGMWESQGKKKIVGGVKLICDWRETLTMNFVEIFWDLLSRAASERERLLLKQIKNS